MICSNLFKQISCEYQQPFKIPLSYIFILFLFLVRTRSGIVEMKRQRMLQQSAPANSGLLSVAHQSGPQNSSSLVPPLMIHRPTINQSMPQTRLNTVFLNQSQAQEKINSKLQKCLNLFYCENYMTIDGSFLKSGLIIFHQKVPENSCFVPLLCRLVQVIKRSTQKRNGSCILACQRDFRGQMCFNLWLFCSVLSPSPR